MDCNFIPCAKWVKRGVAKAKPEVIKLSKEEIKGLVEKAKSDILATAEEIKKSNNGGEGSETQGEDQFNMENYDKEEDAQSLIGIGNLISLDDESENPDSQMEGGEDSEDDSDKEDDEIKPTDNLIAVAHVYGDISVLEVYVFNEEANDLYVHHDTVLPTIPLCLEWLSFVPGQSTPGNLLALGGMTPEITIWDLDIVNSLEPLLKLGEFSKKKKHQHRNHGHRDAVLDLSWNPNLSHVLASGSVDRSVLLWDLGKAKAVTKFADFQEKVQTLEWHPTEVSLLVAGACDRTVTLLDCRIEETLNSLRVEGEVEKVVWHPTSQFNVLVGTSEGVLCCVDCRNGKLLWSVTAHSKEITGLGVHHSNPDSVITCSTDKIIKVWNIAEREPVLTYSKHCNQGDLQCLQVCPENPSVVCVGGDARSNNFRVYNLSTDMDSQQGDSQEMEVSSEGVR